MTQRHLSLAFIVLACGCTASRSGRDDDAPLFGTRRLSTYLLSTDETVSARQLAKMARIIGPYRQLHVDEVAALQARLMKELERLVDVEFAQMTRERAALPLKQRHKVIITRDMARERLLERLGRDLALPILTSDNRSAVVFGRVSEGEVEVTRTAYEIDQPPERLDPAALIVMPDGNRARWVPPLP